MIVKKYNQIFESLNDKVIKTSYYTITPESAEYGDFADSGWYDEDGESMLPDEYDIEENISAIDKAVEFLKNKKYTTEPSSSQFEVGISYSSVSPDHNYSTGEETYYTCHLYGFTPEEEFEIYKKVTDFDAKQLRKDTNKYNL
jgi:hypothetical protein